MGPYAQSGESMLSFSNTTKGVELVYAAERFSPDAWVWEELKAKKEVTVSRIFNFQESDLINPPSPTDDIEGYEFRFRFGVLEGKYVRIPGRILNIKNDVLVSLKISLRRGIFAAERNISIFGRLSDLIEHSNDIVIGGELPDSIPSKVFEELLSKFPNTHEMNRYAGARVHTILSQHLDGMKDAQGKYESYLNRRSSLLQGPLDLQTLRLQEAEKYIMIRDVIEDALSTKKNWPEADWQKLMMSFLLLLFPKYIKVLQNVTINDYYSDPPKKKSRFIDIALIDANGNLDVIEVKKPFDDKIIRKSLYRGNSIPTSELSGSIMQAEKYLFHLSKWGVQGEAALTKRYASELPKGMEIRVSNPKAIIIVGRDQIGGSSMSRGQLLDFEVIKRKYANMMDIITYDDLLRRLNNTIAALKS
jgi:hypothetical protein